MIAVVTLAIHPLDALQIGSFPCLENHACWYDELFLLKLMNSGFYDGSLEGSLYLTSAGILY